MYVSKNFKSKKALREAVAAGEKVEVFSPGPFPVRYEKPSQFVEGPWYPEPHRWYAEVVLDSDGYVVKVK